MTTRRKFKGSPDVEHKHQTDSMIWLRLAHPKVEAMTYAIPMGGNRSAATGAKLKREGAKAGVLDINVDYPLHGLHGLRIEMKPPVSYHRHASEKQKEWIDKFIDAGYAASVAYGFDAFRDLIKDYLAGNPVARVYK